MIWDRFKKIHFSILTIRSCINHSSYESYLTCKDKAQKILNCKYLKKVSRSDALLRIKFYIFR